MRVVPFNMDNRQRKDLVKWELKKTKKRERLERKTQKNFNRDAIEEVHAFAQTYEPNRTDFSIRKMGYRVFHVGSRMRGFVWDRYLPIQYNERKLERAVDILASIAAVKSMKDETAMMEFSEEICRHYERTLCVKSELLASAYKFRAIQNCKNGFKEELMMNVWHPRRVERILEIGGWDLLDNLMGCPV